MYRLLSTAFKTCSFLFLFSFPFFPILLASHCQHVSCIQPNPIPQFASSSTAEKEAPESIHLPLHKAVQKHAYDASLRAAAGTIKTR